MKLWKLEPVKILPLFKFPPSWYLGLLLKTNFLLLIPFYLCHRNNSLLWSILLKVKSLTFLTKLADILKILMQKKILMQEKINLIFSSYLTWLANFRSAEKLWKTSRNVTTTISLWEGRHGWTLLLREQRNQQTNRYQQVTFCKALGW